MRQRKEAALNLFALANTVLLFALAFPFLFTILTSQSLFQNNIYHFTGGKAAFIFVFSILNYLSFISLIALIPRLFLLCLPKKAVRLTKILAVILYASLQLLFITDLLLYQNYQFHLNVELLFLIKQSIMHRVFELSAGEQLLILGVISLIVLIEGLLLKASFFCTKQKKNWPFIGSYIFYLIPSIGMSFSLIFLSLSLYYQNPILLQQTQNIPFYQPLLSKTLPSDLNDAINHMNNEGVNLPAIDAHALNYPATPLICPPKKKQYNLILILVDALRFDAINATTMPNLNQIKHEFSEYTHYFSGGNSTQPGLFSLFYGLPGHYWPSILKTESAPPLHLVLKEQGYASKAIWSAQFNAPAFDKTILQAVDSKVSTHSESPSVKNWDLLTTHKAIDYIAKQEHPFYLHLFYRAPHAYCYAAPFSERFKPMASPCQRIFPKKIKREYYNRYKNALYFIDEEIKKIIDELKHQALWDNSVVIISSDHGEEFDDNNQGYWGHTSNFTKYQTQVPLLIHWPGKKPHRTALRKSHYDLNTTLMKDFLNCQNAPKDFSLGHGLFNQKESDPLWVASYNNQGLLLKNKIFTLSRQGQIQLFDEKAQEIPKTPEELEQLSQALLLLNQYQ